MWRRRILGVGIPTLVAVVVLATAAATAGSSSVGTTISIRALLKNNDDDDDDDDAAFDEEEDYDNTSIVHEEFYRNCWKEKQNSDNYNNNNENNNENGSAIIDYTCMLTSLHLRTIRQVYVQQEVERLLRNGRESSSDEENDDSMMERERDRYNFVLIYDSKYLTLHDDDNTDVEENSPPNGASRNNWEHEQQERFFAAPSSSIVHNDLNKMLYRNFKVRQQQQQQQQQTEDNHTDDELLTEQPIVIQLYCPIGSDNSADLLRHLLMTRPEQRNVLIHTRDQICRTNSGNNGNTHTGNHNHNTDIPLPMYLINTACMATVLEQYTTVTTTATKNNKKKKNQSFNDVLIDSCTSFVSTRPYGISRHRDNDDNDDDTVSGQYTDNSYTTKKKNHEEIVFLRSLQQTEQMYTYFFQQLLQQQQQQQYQHQNNGNGNGDDNNDDWTILSDGSIISSSTGTGDDDNNNRDRHRHEEKTELEEQQDFSQRAQQTLQSIVRDISPEEFAQYKQRYCEMNTRKEKTGRRADGGDATKTTNIIPTAYQDDDNGGDVEDDAGSSSSYNDKSDHDDETSPQPRILWDDEELLPTFDTKEDLLADTTGWSIYLDAVYGLDTFVTTNKNNNNKNAMTGHDHDDNVQKDDTSIFPLKLSHHLTFFYWDMVPVSFKEQIMASYPRHEQQHTIHDGNDNDSNNNNDNNPIHVLPVRPMYNSDLYNIFKLSRWEDFLSLDRDLAWRYMHRSILPFWRTIHSPYNATGVNEEKDSLDVLLPPKPNQQQQQQQQQQQHRSLRYVDTGFADNALVEVMHACCDFGRQDYSSGYWYFVAKGSGVYFDVGKTIIFDDHADAYDTLVGCLYATEQHPWQTDLVQAWNLKTSVTANHEIGVNYDIALVARSLGYDSIQYKNRIEFGFYHYEIVDLRALLIPFTEQRKTCPQQHVVDSALFSGWNGSNKCNCTNDSTTIVNCRDHNEYYHRRAKYKQHQKRSCPATGTAAAGGGSDPSTTCQERRTKKVFIYDYSSVDFDRRLQSLSTLSLDSQRHVLALDKILSFLKDNNDEVEITTNPDAADLFFIPYDLGSTLSNNAGKLGSDIDMLHKVINSSYYEANNGDHMWFIGSITNENPNWFFFKSYLEQMKNIILIKHSELRYHMPLKNRAKHQILTNDRLLNNVPNIVTIQQSHTFSTLYDAIKESESMIQPLISSSDILQWSNQKRYRFYFSSHGIRKSSSQISAHRFKQKIENVFPRKYYFGVEDHQPTSKSSSFQNRQSIMANSLFCILSDIDNDYLSPQSEFYESLATGCIPLVLDDQHFFFPVHYSQNKIQDGVETVFFTSDSYENLENIDASQLKYMVDIMTHLRHKLFFSTGQREIINDAISNAITQYTGSDERHQQQQWRYNEAQEKQRPLFDRKFDGAAGANAGDTKKKVTTTTQTQTPPPPSYPRAQRAEELVDVAGADQCRHYAEEKITTTSRSGGDDDIACNVNYAWMSRNCARTCSQIRTRLKTLQIQRSSSIVIEDDHAEFEFCLKWSERGHCTSNARWMYGHCATTCTYITQGCRRWAQRNECVSNPKFMLTVCHAACAEQHNNTATTTNAGASVDNNERRKQQKGVGGNFEVGPWG